MQTTGVGAGGMGRAAMLAGGRLNGSREATTTALAARIRLWAGFFSKISYPRDLPLVIGAFRHRMNLTIPGHIWSCVDGIGGFLSAKEAALLYQAALDWPAAGAVIELGSYEGRSTSVFALAGRRVHAVDAWSLDVDDLSAYGQGSVSADGVFARFKDNLIQLGIADRVSVHRGDTRAVAQGWGDQGAVLFIDAGHTYEDVSADLKLWTRHLHPQGLLLLHDVLGDTYLGVTKAAGELLSSGAWQVAASAGSVVGFTRR